MSRRLKAAFLSGVFGLLLVLGLLAVVHLDATSSPLLNPEQENTADVTVATIGTANRAGQLVQASNSAERAPRTPAGSGSSPAARALEDYLTWAKYPPCSRPADEHADAMRIHSPVPSWHPLEAKKRGVVMIRQTQDALYLAAGETAVVTLLATVASRRAPLRVLAARVAGGGGTDALRPEMVPVMFRDDGVAPDQTAADGELTAAIRAPAAIGKDNAFRGTLRLEVDLAAAGEAGTAWFRFLCTGDAPARFTGVLREQLEAGSLALYVEMEIFRSGRYVIQARLDDAAQRPIALLRFNDWLDPSWHEVRLLAFGKLLRDRGAVSPLVLRDLQAWRLREDESPDRELVPRWQAHYTTQEYSLGAMSDREWESPSKTGHIRGLQRILAAQ